MKYIFVVGCAKTGSKLVRSILMTNPRVNILDELHLLEPWWLKQDFARLARKIGPLSDDGNIHKSFEKMSEGKRDESMKCVQSKQRQLKLSMRNVHCLLGRVTIFWCFVFCGLHCIHYNVLFWMLFIYLKIDLIKLWGFLSCHPRRKDDSL